MGIFSTWGKVANCAAPIGGMFRGGGPIPAAAWVIIWPYVQQRLGEPRLFPDTFTSKTWTRLRRAAGLPVPLSKKEKREGKRPPAQTFHFHDLRVLFASGLAVAKVPTGVTQKLLEHSTAALTNEVYTDFDPTLRPAVELLPVADWLREVETTSSEVVKESDHTAAEGLTTLQPRQNHSSNTVES